MYCILRSARAHGDRLSPEPDTSFFSGLFSCTVFRNLNNFQSIKNEHENSDLRRKHSLLLFRIGMDDLWKPGKGFGRTNFGILPYYSKDYLIVDYFELIVASGFAWQGFSSHWITTRIHFLSSVISMVAPTWCHGPVWGNPIVGDFTPAWLLNWHILTW